MIDRSTIVKGSRSPEERAAVISADHLCRAIIGRIEFPRRKAKGGKFGFQGIPLKLSETDRSEAYSAGILALAQSGFFHHGKIHRHQIFAVFRAMRRALRLDRRHKPEICMPQDALNALHDSGANMEFAPLEDMGGKRAVALHAYATNKEIERFRLEALRVMEFSFKTLTSRSKAKDHASHVAFLESLCTIARGETASGGNSLNVSLNRRNRFIAYLEKGRALQRQECTGENFDSFGSYLEAMIATKGKPKSKA